ncbi:unnamed protein product, partial [Brassica napus]
MNPNSESHVSGDLISKKSNGKDGSPPTSRSNVPAKAVCLPPKLSPAILCRRNQTARPLSPPLSPSNKAAEPVSLNLSLYLHIRLFLTFRSTFMQPLINSTNG